MPLTVFIKKAANLHFFVLVMDAVILKFQWLVPYIQTGTIIVSGDNLSGTERLKYATRIRQWQNFFSGSNPTAKVTGVPLD